MAAVGNSSVSSTIPGCATGMRAGFSSWWRNMKAKKKRTGVSKAEKLRVAQRVEEVLRLRLGGVQFWDVREHVREKEQEDDSPWKLANRAKPLSDSQLRRYIQRADALILASVKEPRSKAIRRHLARRE